MAANVQKNVSNYNNEDLSNIIDEEFIISFIPLVKKIVNKLIVSGIPRNEYDDLVEQGIMGLINAYLNYNPDKSVKFETYASIRIRGEILDYLRSKDWMPRNLRKKIKDISKITDFTDISGEDIDALCNKLNISKEDYYKLQTQIVASNISSLDDILENNLTAVISVDDLPERETLIKDERRIIKESIDNLNEREKLIITLYYYEELSLKEISHVLDVSESRVSQIHSRALAKLRQMLQNYYTI